MPHVMETGIHLENLFTYVIHHDDIICHLRDSQTWAYTVYDIAYHLSCTVAYCQKLQSVTTTSPFSVALARADHSRGNSIRVVYWWKILELLDKAGQLIQRLNLNGQGPAGCTATMPNSDQTSVFKVHVAIIPYILRDWAHQLYLISPLDCGFIEHVHELSWPEYIQNDIMIFL